jgi:hypothetical protein
MDPPLLAGIGLASGLAMVVSNGAMTALGIAPRSWSTQDWISDVVPHLA